jgi:hypothetical protein
MWFKHRAWIPVAWLLALGNLAAVWFAAQPGEPLHAALHALLGAGFALGAQRLMARRRSAVHGDHVQDTLEQNEHLQQALDDMQPRLLELEERLDFAERLLTRYRDAERLDAPPR